MYRSIASLVAWLALAGIASASLQVDRHAASAHSRRLLNAAAPAAALSAKQCMWVAESSSCEAADAVDIMYAVRSKPISPYLWFLLMTHDHKHACEDYQSRDSCRSDTAHSCVWLDDILDDSSSSGSSSSKAKRPAAKTSSAERAARISAVPNLFTARMTAMQAQFASLREMLGRPQALLNPLREVAAGAKPADSAGTPAQAPAPSSSSSKKAGSSGRKGKATLKCTSREVIENFIYTQSGYSSVLQAPLAMHCPGSKAFDLVRCMSQTTNAACTSTPGCVVVPRIGSKGAADLCVSQYFNRLSKDQMNQFVQGLTLAEPAVVGSCDGACWMRQSLLCNHTKGPGDCSSLSFCRSLGGECVPKLYDHDYFGSSVQEYLGECVETDNKQDCESKTIKLVNKGKYAQWTMPARHAAGFECNVPSVRGMLGRASTVAKEGAARLEMLTMMGAETEKQAAAFAAATAAQDAVKAGKILAERGVTGLQQLYSSVSTILG